MDAIEDAVIECIRLGNLSPRGKDRDVYKPRGREFSHDFKMQLTEDSVLLKERKGSTFFEKVRAVLNSAGVSPKMLATGKRKEEKLEWALEVDAVHADGTAAILRDIASLLEKQRHSTKR